MRIYVRPESDEWTREGRKITDAEKLEAIRRTLDEIGPVIVEHWFYRGSRAPERLVFDDYEDFQKLLETGCRAGDKLYVWSFAQVCRHDNTLADGKCPDDDGFVPRKGAY
jgi:hypothetical protein